MHTKETVLSQCCSAPDSSFPRGTKDTGYKGLPKPHIPSVGLKHLVPLHTIAERQMPSKDGENHSTKV